MSTINRIDECFQLNKNIGKPPAPDAPGILFPLPQQPLPVPIDLHYQADNHGNNKSKVELLFDRPILVKEKEYHQQAHNDGLETIRESSPELLTSQVINNQKKDLFRGVLRENIDNQMADSIMGESAATRDSSTIKESFCQESNVEMKMNKEDAMKILSTESIEEEEKDSGSLVRGRNHIEFEDIQEVKSEIYRPKNDEGSGRGNSLESLKDSLQAKISRGEGIKESGSIGAKNYKKLNINSPPLIFVQRDPLEELKKFPLEKLRITKNKRFDLRFNISHEFLALCLKAHKDPMQFYEENFEREERILEAKKPKEPLPLAPLPLAENQAGEGSKTTVKEDFSHHKIESKLVSEYLDLCRLAKEDPVEYFKGNALNEKEEIKCNSENEYALNLSLKLLKQFPLDKLELTLNGFVEKGFEQNNKLDMKCQETVKPENKNKSIEEIKTVNPVEVEEPRKKSALSVSSAIFVRPEPPGPPSWVEERLKGFPFEELKIIGRGFFNRRCSRTREYLDLCSKANRDPMQYYNENYKKQQAKSEPAISEEENLERLEYFPFGQLKITLKGFFNLNYSITHEYLGLCKKFNKDPLEYYHEKYIQKLEENQSEMINGDVSMMALEKLESFPFEKLKITLKGFFDMRYNVTSEYLNLCASLKKDPLEYYNEKYIQKQNERADVEKVKESVVGLEELKSFPLDELKITLSGFFDRRYNLTKRYLELCQIANQDPLEYYHETLKKKPQEKCCEKGMCDSCYAKDDQILEELKRFPLIDLKMTEKGFFDRRFRLTKDYLNLCTKAGKDPLNYYNENLNKQF